MINLRDDLLALVKNILHIIIPDREVMIFGSRVSGQPKAYSDIDLCVMGDTPLSLKEYGTLVDAFAESNLPFQVDIVEWARIDSTMKSIIQKNGVKLQ